MRQSKVRRASPIFLAAALLTTQVGCSDDEESSPTEAVDGGMSPDAGSGAQDAGAAVNDVSSKAANLRVGLNLLLSEHLVLASKATGAALGSRTAEFDAYGKLLNTNGTELGALVGQAFGAEAQTEFNRIWSAHNGFFVDYTTGVATSDETKKNRAVSDLTTVYVPQFAKFLAGATALPESTLASLTMEHVVTTKNIVDAQWAKDWPKAFTAIRAAFSHMQMIGDPLSVAIAKKLPQAFPGNAEAKSVSFRVALNERLQEHLYLASYATGAALGGRTDEYMAAGTALNANGTDLGSAIGSLYGAEAQTQFNGIWSAHNGFFVDYTLGVAEKNETKKGQAVTNLTTVYVPQFAKFLAGATSLPESALASLTMEHVVTTKNIVDAQGAGTWQAAADADRHAGQHMQEIGDPLAQAIVAKQSAKF